MATPKKEKKVTAKSNAVVKSDSVFKLPVQSIQFTVRNAGTSDEYVHFQIVDLNGSYRRIDLHPETEAATCSSCGSALAGKFTPQTPLVAQYMVGANEVPSRAGTGKVYFNIPGATVTAALAAKLLTLAASY